MSRVVVVGAGVVGLAIASELSEVEKEVYVFEKNFKYGMETSSRNSGVVHAGIYYPKDSLKSKLCIQGNRLLYDFCIKHNVRYKKLGKLIIATDDKEVNDLKKLYKNGKECGVSGLEILEKEDFKKLEPFIDGEKALFSPSSGIVDQSNLLYALYAKAKNNGALCVFRTEVEGVKPLKNGGYEINGVSAGEKFSLETDFVINSAGLYSDRIAASCGINLEKAGYRLNFCKGDYFRIVGNAPVKRLVYPVPPKDEKDLGVHLTPDIYGNVRLGPNAYFTKKIDYNIESKAEDFKTAVKRFFPLIKKYEIEEDFSGIRPQLKGSGFKDFVIKHEADNGFFGLINLIGIDSPGLTACIAIGKYVKEIYEKEIRRS